MTITRVVNFLFLAIAVSKYPIRRELCWSPLLGHSLNPALEIKGASTDRPSRLTDLLTEWGNDNDGDGNDDDNGR